MTRPAHAILASLLVLAALSRAAAAQAEPAHAPAVAPQTGQPEASPALFPDTPAGRAARDWFEAVRSKSEPAIREMIETRFDAAFLERVPLEQHLEMHVGLAASGLSLPHSIASQTDHEITYYLRDGGVWGLLRISVARDEPHNITMVAVRPSEGPPELQGRPKTMKAFRDETVEFLDALRDNGRFEGVVVATAKEIDPNDVLVWSAPDAPRDIPIDFVLDAIKLAVPLSVAHKSWQERHPPDGVLATGPGDHTPEELASLEDIRRTQGEPPLSDRQAELRALIDAIFAGNTPTDLAFQRGLVHALVFEPLWMNDCEVPFAAEGRMNPFDLVRFSRGLLDPEYIRPHVRNDATTGVGPDLDPSPRIVRRNAMAGFEERIDGNGVRSFSLRHAGDDTHVLMRCYPSAGYTIVIVAQDDKTLNLIDRRLFARLPGLEPPAAAPAD